MVAVCLVYAVACSTAEETQGDAGIDGEVLDGAADGDAATLPPLEGRIFTDVTAEAGVEYVQWAGEPPISDSWIRPVLPCTGGAAAGDLNGDGWPDLYVTRLDGPDVLFRNQGDGTFEDVTMDAGLGQDLHSNGVAIADVNDDGHLDVAITTVADTRLYLFINQGDGTFAEEAVDRGMDLDEGELRSGFGLCFGDYDKDGWLDLHTSDWDQRTDSGLRTRLLRNRGAVAPGHFEDVTIASGVVAEAGEDVGVLSFTSFFGDFDSDGWPDLALVADYGTTQFFWNDGDGTFTEGTDMLGDNVPSDENGMGIAVGDYDQDGALDWFVTSIYDPRFPCDGCFWGRSGNRLYRNVGGRRFEEVTELWGVREGGWGWGTQFFDYDNDGDLDLGMTNGYVLDSSTEPFWTDRNRLWRNDGAPPFVEVSEEAGLDDVRSGKSFVVFDYDLDGDLDVFISHTEGTPVLYRNDRGNERNWLRVDLRGRGASEGGTNHFGIGARISVRTSPDAPPLIREVMGCSYLEQSRLPEHFGLGSEPEVSEVRVQWPVTGLTSVVRDVRSNQTIVIEEPD